MYARVAAAAMSSINSVSTGTPCQSVNFEGGAWPLESRLQDSQKLDGEELHSAQKSVASTSYQAQNPNTLPTGPANQRRHQNQNHVQNHARTPTDFMNDGLAVPEADEVNKLRPPDGKNGVHSDEQKQLLAADGHLENMDGSPGRLSANSQDGAAKVNKADSETDFNTSDHEQEAKQQSIKDLRKRVLTADKIGTRQSMRLSKNQLIEPRTERGGPGKTQGLLRPTQEGAGSQDGGIADIKTALARESNSFYAKN